jgi:hypothetical protein
MWLLSFLGLDVYLSGLEGEKVCACVWMLVVVFYLVDLFVIVVAIW